jgi:cytochrome c peroxidase
MRSRLPGLCGGLMVLLAACDQPGFPTGPTTTPIDAQLRQELTRWGVVPIAEMPAQDPALVDLGRMLMFDKILSGNRDVSCATCHDPAMHLGDGLSLSIGTGGIGSGAERALGPGRQFLPRNAPSLLNEGLRAQYVFWDGRISGFQSGPFTAPPGIRLPGGLPNILAAQAMIPVLDRREMRGAPGDTDVLGAPNELGQYADSQYADVWQAIMRRVLAIPAYQSMFAAAFPDLAPSALRFQHAATAIAAFIMDTYTRVDSPFDRYLRRDDAALSIAAKQGALQFFDNATCATCHNGPLLGGQEFANDGVPQLGPGVGKGAPLDLGRGGLADTVPQGPGFDRFAFRVPPLRNVELTGPYMHDGVYPTLDAVLSHYSDVPAALSGYDVSQVSAVLRPLYHGDAASINEVSSTLDFRVSQPFHFTAEEKSDLLAFLRSLTDPAARDLSALIPASVPSGLPVR